MPMTAQEGETPTGFAIRCIKAQAFAEGVQSVFDGLDTPDFDLQNRYLHEGESLEGAPWRTTQ